MAMATSAAARLTNEQREMLRTRLEEAATESRSQFEQNIRIFESLADDSSADATGHDRQLARISADRAQEALDDIESALERLAEGRYGICAACGGAIPFERLEAVPQARFCISCPRPGGLVR
jgi:RNA polymerase-binding protein DksA